MNKNKKQLQEISTSKAYRYIAKAEISKMWQPPRLRARRERGQELAFKAIDLNKDRVKDLKKASKLNRPYKDRKAYHEKLVRDTNFRYKRQNAGISGVPGGDTHPDYKKELRMKKAKKVALVGGIGAAVYANHKLRKEDVDMKPLLEGEMKSIHQAVSEKLKRGHIIHGLVLHRSGPNYAVVSTAHKKELHQQDYHHLRRDPATGEWKHMFISNSLGEGFASQFMARTKGLMKYAKVQGQASMRVAKANVKNAGQAVKSAAKAHPVAATVGAGAVGGAAAGAMSKKNESVEQLAKSLDPNSTWTKNTTLSENKAEKGMSKRVPHAGLVGTGLGASLGYALSKPGKGKKYALVGGLAGLALGKYQNSKKGRAARYDAKHIGEENLQEISAGLAARYTKAVISKSRNTGVNPMKQGWKMNSDARKIGLQRASQRLKSEETNLSEMTKNGKMSKREEKGANVGMATGAKAGAAWGLGTGGMTGFIKAHNLNKAVKIASGGAASLTRAARFRSTALGAGVGALTAAVPGALIGTLAGADAARATRKVRSEGVYISPKGLRRITRGVMAGTAVGAAGTAYGAYKGTKKLKKKLQKEGYFKDTYRDVKSGVKLAINHPGKALRRAATKPIRDIANAQKKVIKGAAVAGAGIAGYAAGTHLMNNSTDQKGEPLSEAASLQMDVYKRIDSYKAMGFRVTDISVGETKAHFTVVDKEGNMRKHIFDGNKRRVEDLGSTKPAESDDDSAGEAPVKKKRGRPPKNKFAVKVKK
jgi:hypothetical protein